MKTKITLLLLYLSIFSVGAVEMFINDYGFTIQFYVNDNYTGDEPPGHQYGIYAGQTAKWYKYDGGQLLGGASYNPACDLYPNETVPMSNPGSCGYQYTPATNHWSQICVTNNTSIPQPYQFYTSSGGTMGNPVQVVPANTIWCFNMTNTTPFTICAGSATLEVTFCNPPSTPATYTNSPPTNNFAPPSPPAPDPLPLTNSPFVPTNIVPANAGTNGAMDSTVARGFNALLTQGQDAAKQSDSNARQANYYLQQISTNSGFDDSRIVGALGAITNLMGAGTNGTMGAAMSGNTNFSLTSSNDFVSLAGTPPTIGSTAPLLSIPLGSLGFTELEDVPIDYTSAGLAPVVEMLRPFLLFLVSVAFLILSLRVFRQLAPP